MNYPQRQQTQNAWQAAGQALQGAGETVGQFSDKQAQMRALFQQMVEKRQAAILAQKQQEQEMELKRAEDARQEAESGRKQQEADRMGKAVKDFQTFTLGQQKITKEAESKPYAAPGLGPNGEQAMEVPAQYEAQKPTREEMQQKALETGAYADPSVKAYMDDTNPTKTLEGQKELLGIKGEISEKVAAARQAHMLAMEEFRLGRVPASVVFSARAAMERAQMSDKSKPKTESGMPLKALGDTELKTIKDIQNTAYSINKIRALADTISTLKRGPIAGRILGKNPYDVELQALERLVNQTVPGMARGVFGEVGVLTDEDVNRYRQMLASVKDDPKLAGVILDELQEKIDSAYQISLDTYNKGGRDVSGFDTAWNSRSAVDRRRPTETPRTLDDAIKQSVDGIKEGSEIRLTGDKAKRLAELRAKAAQGTIK